MGNYYLNVESNNIGGYFSSEQIDLLSIIQCTSIEELQKFIVDCEQIKDFYFDEEIKNLSQKDLEIAKKEVFKKYQESLVFVDDDIKIDIVNKLKHMGIKEEHYSVIEKLSATRDLDGIRKFIQDNYPENKIDDMLIAKHRFTSQARDQLKDESMYEEFQLLNQELSSFNTLLIGSGKVYNVVNELYRTDEVTKRFDFYHAKRDLDFAFKNGKQVRYHALLVRDDPKKLFEGKEPAEIKQILTDYVKQSIDFVNQYNQEHQIEKNGVKVPMISSIDLFNEIVSFDKNEKGEYVNIWIDKYGLSMKDLMDIYKYANDNKPKGVSYLYNEPFLENEERRNKVFETLRSIKKEMPNLIDTLGSQMHITVTHELDEIEKCFRDFKKIQDELGIKLQITEFDMCVGKRAIQNIFKADSNISIDYVYAAKRQKIEDISQIIKQSGVKLSGISYWSLTDGIDSNLQRIRTELLNNKTINDIRQIPTAFGGLIPTFQILKKKR